ncbi:MAG: 4Fe-4S dicluster domain-containing protein [Eggerthellaceae bacterium]|nr:4Fe-4S dicluster domain-containing protein [Eggerthellaceae bacterium]
MTQMGFLLDQKYCIGCQTCQHACRVRHGIEPGTYPRKATSSQVEVTGPYISLACNHCDNPACVEACPTSSLTKRESDGVVVHNPETCIGCLSCQAACPYDVPELNEVSGKMIKCDFCAARLDAGDTPACVLSCPVKVLTFGTIEELEAQGGVAEGVGFTVEDTSPNMRFIPIS